MKQEFNQPAFYWNMAKEYIIKKDSELRSEGKYYIDKKISLSCIIFASFLKHTGSKFADITFQFQEWQVRAIIDIFGTKYLDGEYKGLRRYQRALFFMPKKNGKTELGAVLHLIMLFIDPKKKKEQYCVATNMEQALILHEAMETMVKSNDYNLINSIDNMTVQPPRITKKEGAYKQTITSLAKPQGDGKDGKKVTFFTSDEGHAQESKALFQLIKNGMASEEEPLEINLSTAGYNKENYFYLDIYLYAKKVKNGTIKDDRFYSVMFEIDEDEVKELEEHDPDYWKKEKYWKKVNPNYGISPTKSFLEGLVNESEYSESSKNTFKTKHLNIFMDKLNTWIKSRVWESGQTKIGYTKLKQLRGKKCYGGLDLASTDDIAAFVLIFPEDDGSYTVIPRFYIPRDNMTERARTHKVPYLDWHKDKLIVATKGTFTDIIDYDFIYNDIARYSEFFDVHMIAYDRWNSSDLVQKLTKEDVTEMFKFGQGFASMSSPTKQIEVLAKQNRLNHGNNKVLNWMCQNVSLRFDAADNIKIDKENSIEKVDGMVALAMALGVCIIDTKTEEKNIYNDRGLRDLKLN